jgi:hypothetical protein
MVSGYKWRISQLEVYVDKKYCSWFTMGHHETLFDRYERVISYAPFHSSIALETDACFHDAR